MRNYRIALAQLNPTVGDIGANTEKIRTTIHEAKEKGAQLIVFPELAITGYPPEDLVLRTEFAQSSRAAISSLLPDSTGIIAVVGFVDIRDDAYNSAALLVDGGWVDTYDKRRLPNYGVFDEQRVFAQGSRLPLYRAGDLDFAITICEDIWYPGAPLEPLALAGAELILCLNASPYRRGKIHERERMLSVRASDNSCVLVYVNTVGGQDELVFDGGSMVHSASGKLLARSPQFEEDMLLVDIDLDAVRRTRLHDPRRRVEKSEPTSYQVERITIPYTPPTLPVCSASSVAPVYEPLAEVWQALVVGTRDYLKKTGFSKVLIGLSGGIDSAVVAVLAADALGASNVTGVRMPSRYSSQHSLDDAAALADTLGMSLLTIPIEAAHVAMLEMTGSYIKGPGAQLAEENLQARQRGNVLMTISNATGALVLATGNKSEMSVGYATLYGDMVGGYAVIKDIPKTLVYELANWRNAQGDAPVIPTNSIVKPPSAELRPGQVDADALPAYEILDGILHFYVEVDESPDEIIARGYEEATVRRVVRMTDRAEFKRRQAPPGVRITPRAFGKDRRYPIASGWRS